MSLESGSSASNVENKAKTRHRWSISARPTESFSMSDEHRTPPLNNNRNRLRSFCSTIKRRLSFGKDDRTMDDDFHRSFPNRTKNYKSFSSSSDERSQDFEWPDFEKVYETIPSCLIRTLPGVDTISADFEDDDDDSSTNSSEDGFTTDESPEQTLAEINRFENCKRGKNFHRNGLCRKLDKTLYKNQLDTFIQQLMLEKLIRMWS